MVSCNRAFLVCFASRTVRVHFFIIHLCVLVRVLQPTNVCVVLIKSLDLLQDSFTGTWNQRIYYVRGRSSLRSQTSVWRERFDPVLPTQTTCPPDGQFSPSMYIINNAYQEIPRFLSVFVRGRKVSVIFSTNRNGTPHYWWSRPCYCQKIIWSGKLGDPT